MLAFLMLMCWWIFTTSIKATTVLAVCVILIVCNHLVVQNQVRQYNSMTYILTELLDAEKYLELCQVLNEKIKRTSGMSALNLANAYYWTGHFDKAKETLEKAVINGNKQATTVMDV
ncbi:MAG: tetratricopeptide repeat protein, partial [Clostridia bacterium]|nr:tetratricopeptide repeat protein [Clostridia bacterium]